MTRTRTMPPPRMRPAPAGDPIADWLDRLVRIMRLPPREAREVRDELESHLRERVRDLMLAGHDEPVAIHHAISELGDCALLAQRLRAAHRAHWNRRICMLTSTVALAASVVAITAVTLSPAPSAGTMNAAPIVSAQPTEASPPSMETVRRVLATRVDLETDTSFDEFFDMISEIAGECIIDAYAIQRAFAIELHEPMGIQARNVTIEKVLDVLARRNERTPVTLQPYETGVEITVMEFVPPRQDRIELFVYEIGPILDAGVSKDDISDLLLRFVSPENWAANGGRLADFKIVADRLFVEAPLGDFDRIERVLREFTPDSTPDGEPADTRRRDDSGS